MGVFRSDGDYIYLDTQYIEFYIPMYYFDSSKHYAEDLSDKIDVLGFFNVGLFSNGKFTEMKTFNVPTRITIFVYDSEVREVKLPNNVTMPCKVVKYIKNNKIMQSGIFENSTNSEEYLNFITNGGIPRTIPYTKSLQLWRKNMELNNVHLGVSSTILELILSVVYRSSDNMSEKFSKVIGKDPTHSPYDYQVASIRQICQYASTFTALTFEDIDSMITTSINKNREHQKETISPVEKIIKY